MGIICLNQSIVKSTTYNEPLVVVYPKAMDRTALEVCLIPPRSIWKASRGKDISCPFLGWWIIAYFRISLVCVVNHKTTNMIPFRQECALKTKIICKCDRNVPSSSKGTVVSMYGMLLNIVPNNFSVFQRFGILIFYDLDLVLYLDSWKMWHFSW